MIIKANSKKDTSILNNYKIIYQKIKEEIKSVVITKLLNQVQILSNNYQKLQKENALIKNDLIYILKRILLNKKEYNKINITDTNKAYQMKSVYSMPYLTNGSFINCKSYNSILSADTINENNNNYNNYYNVQSHKNLFNNNRTSSLKKRQIENRRYSIDDDTKKGNNSSLNNIENSIQFNNIQNKVDYYLNSLYKHNFAEDIISGTSSIHLLNKDKPLYEELFPRKNKNYPYLKTEFNFKKISSQKAKKKLVNVDNNKDINIKTDSQNDNDKDRKIQKNINYLKVQRKNNNNNNKKKNLQIRANTNVKLINSDYKNLTNSQNKINNKSKFVMNKFIFK